MHKEVFTKLLTDFAQPLASEIACEQDWLHAAFCHQQLPLANTVYSFFQLRANRWIYAGERKLDVSDIRMEQSYIRLFLSLHWEILDLKPIDWAQAESELDRLLEFIKKPEVGESVSSFFINNLIENFNVLCLSSREDNSSRTDFYLRSLEKLLSYCLFYNKRHYFSSFDFNSHYQRFFTAASPVEQDNFLNTFLSINWFSITSHPGPMGSWLHFLLTTSHKARVVSSYFQAVNQDSDLVFQSIQFFSEEELKYVVNENSPRRELEILLKIYSRLKDPFFLAPWESEDYENLLVLLKREVNLPHYSLNSFIILLSKYYDMLLSAQELGNEVYERWQNKLSLIEEILKLHFDLYLLPQLNPWERKLMEEFPPLNYHLLDWESSKVGPVPEIEFFNASLSASENIEQLFGIKSFRFKRHFLSLLYDNKFKRVNSELLSLSLLRELFQDKNYLLNLIDHFAQGIAHLTASYPRFLRAFSTYQAPFEEVKKAKEFIAIHYSEEKLYHFLLKTPDYFTNLQNLIDCARGYEGLKTAVAEAKSEKALRMLSLPSRVKTLEELHTVIYQRVALLKTEKVELYSESHPIFVIDGFMFLNGWTISVPKNSWELKIYGINMHNCVGGYVDKILRNESLILNLLYKNKPLMNVEIKNRKIWEMKKLKNETLSEQETKEISLVLAQSGLTD